LWDAVAKRLGIAYRLDPMAFKDVIPALVQKRIDVALAGMTVNSTREKQIDFSVPYYISSLAVLVRADATDIDGVGDLDDKIVATKQGTSSAVFVKNIQTRSFKLYGAIEEAYAALEKGTVDAVIFDEPAIEAYVRSKGAGRAKIVEGSYHRQYYGFGFQPNSPWRKKINITLLRLMEEGYYDILFRKWFGYVPQ
jgi:glutamine transport system substrate-binding protein